MSPEAHPSPPYSYETTDSKTHDYLLCSFTTANEFHLQFFDRLITSFDLLLKGLHGRIGNDSPLHDVEVLVHAIEVAFMLFLHVSGHLILRL